MRACTPYERIVATPTSCSDVRPKRSAILRPDVAKGAGNCRLESHRDSKQRHVTTDDDEGELPRVQRHHHEHHGRLERGHHHARARPLHEVPHRVHVARHARHVSSALFGVLRQHRQPVDVVERALAERSEASLGGNHHAPAHSPLDEHRDQHDDRAARDQLMDDREVHPARRQDALVGHALSEVRNGRPCRRGYCGERDRHAQPLAHLGRDRESAAQGLAQGRCASRSRRVRRPRGRSGSWRAPLGPRQAFASCPARTRSPTPCSPRLSREARREMPASTTRPSST